MDKLLKIIESYDAIVNISVNDIKKYVNLKEWADTVVFPESGDILEHTDEGAYPFIYSYNENKIYLGHETDTHSFISTYKVAHDKKNDGLMGRIWTIEKIISFWEYPDTVHDYRNIIKLLNEELKNKRINTKVDNSWRLDLPSVSVNLLSNSWQQIANQSQHKEKVRDFREIKSFFIPALEWFPDIMKNPKQYKAQLQYQRYLHVMTPSDKARLGLKVKAPGFGADKRYKVSDMSKVGSAYKQGDIPQHVAHQLKYTSESLNENVGDREFGCLMLKINFPNWEKFVHSYVKEEDVYEINSDEYGYEEEPHVTILYGFKYDDDIDKIKKILTQLKNEIRIFIKDIDIFSTDKFDVVKFNVESKMLVKLNEIMSKNFDHIVTYRDYKPHMTIAYVKKGTGEKYVKKTKKSFILRSKTFEYSFINGRNEYFSI